MVLTNFHIYRFAITPSTPLSTDMSVDFHRTSLDDDIKAIKRLIFVSADSKYYFHIIHYPSLNITVEDVADYGVLVGFKALIDGTTTIPDELIPLELSMAVNFFGSNYTHTTLSIIDDFRTDVTITITPDTDYFVVNYSILVGDLGNFTKIHPSILNNVITFNHNDLIDYMFEYLSPSLRINVSLTTLSEFALILYKSSAEKNVVNKISYLTFVGNESGTLRESCNIINPVITIQYTQVPNFNYVWIPSLNRYYFVNSVVSASKDIWVLSLTEDVLMTYNELIRQQTLHVSRNENEFDNYIVDNQRTFKNTPSFEYVEIENAIFDVTTSSTTIDGKDRMVRFVLTVVGED